MDAEHKEKITKILTAACAAPSGDNSQPWRFVVRAPDTIEFHAIPEKDNELLNIDHSGTLIALGAAIQNAELEAKVLGFDPEIRYNDEGTLVATFILHSDGHCSEAEQKLQKAIIFRHTNRKAYKKMPLALDDRQAIFDSVGELSNVSFFLVEDQKPMNIISRALTTMEEIALRNKAIHNLFFKSIFWSKEQNRAGKSGLYIKTLELPPPAQILFKVLRYWPVAYLLSWIGFPSMVAQTNAKQNASTSAFGVITSDRFNPGMYIEAGRLLERLWLTAASRGLSLQIVTGLLFLARTIEQRNPSIFSDKERLLALDAYARIRANLGPTQEPFLMFRVGYSVAPSAVSFRQAPVVAGI